ncbi:MAG: polysaccharide export protein [Alphaproteobacteria bacterium]|nr:polysaccharide export protein [Alphaproteobacteria bacterium]
MSSQGPTTRDITGDAGPDTGYVVVRLTPAVLPQLEALKMPSLAETFGDVAPAPVKTMSPGDVVSVAIWDAGGGLFSPEGSATLGTQTTVIPPQMVDIGGNISVPFAGQIHVAGKSTLQVQNAIAAALVHQTLRPQVLVTIATEGSNSATVIGDVKQPGRLQLTTLGSRVLDAIAIAGGTNRPPFDEAVELTRKGKTKRLRLSWLLAHPAENVFLQPDDLLYIVHSPKAVTVLGALKANSRLEFDTEQVTLAEVLGQAGGLVDLQAEPAGVFVFRLEPAPLVAALTHGPAISADNSSTVPVIFRADLRQAGDFFLAQSFQMHDKDIVYVANAETVQLDKVLREVLHAAGIAGIVANRYGIAAGN